MKRSAYILRQSFRVRLTWGRASWVCSGPTSLFSPWGGGVLHSCGTAAQHRQPPARAPQPKNTRASSAQSSENCSHRGVDLPVLSALRKPSFASKRPCYPQHHSRKATLPQRRLTNNTSPQETFHGSAKANTAQPRRVQLHQEKENNKQDEEAEKPPPVKPTGELT